MVSKLKHQKNPIFGFTFRTQGKALELINEIYVSEASDLKDQNNLPVRKPYSSIWDTGATGSVITEKAAKELSLQPSGKTTIRVVGLSNTTNEFETNTYLVNLYLPPHVVIPARVAEGSVGGADILIGMDVIGLGDFAVTNHNGNTTWTFRIPSCYEIDFVGEIEEYNKKFKPAVQLRKDRNKRKAEKRRK